jgi:3-oxoacyl-[acyl-carrier protein] reductase
MEFNFKNRTLLLTGAAGGIGREIATKFYNSGGSMVLGDVDVETVEAFARTLSPTLDRIVCSGLDSGNSDSVRKFVGIARDAYGTVDVVVPAAGIYPESSVDSTTDEMWRKVMSINLDGVFFLLRDVKSLLTSGSSVVNITSIAGHKGSHSHGHYSASKGGLLSLTRTLALEWGPENIRVNAVSPGIISTSMTTDLVAQRGEALLAGTPLHRYGQPSEVADVILFLASDASSFVHGEVIHINGGMYMAG